MRRSGGKTGVPIHSRIIDAVCEAGTREMFVYTIDFSFCTPLIMNNMFRAAGLESRESAVISYPLKGKAKDSIIYLRSQGEIVEYRDETTGKLMNGFILVNSLIE